MDQSHVLSPWLLVVFILQNFKSCLSLEKLFLLLAGEPTLSRLFALLVLRYFFCCSVSCLQLFGECLTWGFSKYELRLLLENIGNASVLINWKRMERLWLTAWTAFPLRITSLLHRQAENTGFPVFCFPLQIIWAELATKLFSLDLLNQKDCLVLMTNQQGSFQPKLSSGCLVNSVTGSWQSLKLTLWNVSIPHPRFGKYFGF